MVAGEDAATASPSPRRQRSDVERNRSALLEAAKGLYASEGIDVSLEEIARLAGVGIGTLYRHFPRAKEQLVSEALVDQVARYVAAAHRALGVPDPWQGFASLVEEICAMQENDLGLSDVLAMVLPASERVEKLRSEANDLVIEIVDRAKKTGKLRSDFVGEDLLLLLVAHAAVFRVTRQDAPGASSRMVALFLEAVGTRRARGPLPDPPSSDQMRRSMVRLAATRGCAAETHTVPQNLPTS